MRESDPTSTGAHGENSTTGAGSVRAATWKWFNQRRKKTMHDEYLGDGVYASYDGLYLWLDLRGQDTTTRIGLDPQVLKRLDKYRKRLRELPEEDHE